MTWFSFYPCWKSEEEGEREEGEKETMHKKKKKKKKDIKNWSETLLCRPHDCLQVLFWAILTENLERVCG